jgi:hypothetical protein
MNNPSSRKTRPVSLGLSCHRPIGWAKIFQILKDCDRLTNQDKFRHEINEKHRKKTQAQLFNKWKSRF